MSERGGFDVTCPCCRATFKAVRPLRPFRRATPESVAQVPPTVRKPPKAPADHIIVRCEHCTQEFHPARGTKKPRFCSKSCARRSWLARKHGLAAGVSGAD